MKSSLTLLGLLLAATHVATQDGGLTTEEPVTAGASPSVTEGGGGGPTDCVPDEASTFNIKVDSDFQMKPKTSKRSFHPANIFKLKVRLPLPPSPPSLCCLPPYTFTLPPSSPLLPAPLPEPANTLSSARTPPSAHPPPTSPPAQYPS